MDLTLLSLSINVFEFEFPPSPSGKQKDLGLILLRLSSLIKKFVICGHCLVTLPPIINETLKLLSSLPVLTQEAFRW